MNYLKNNFAWTAVVFFLINSNFAHADPQIDQACATSGDLATADFWNTAGYSSFPSSILTTGTADEIAQATIQFCEDYEAGDIDCLGIAPWLFLNSSRTEVKEAALLIQETLAQNFLSRLQAPSTDLHTILQAAAIAPPHYSAAVAQNFKTIITNGLADKNDNPLQALMKGGFITAAGVCSLFSLSPDCSIALSESFSIGEIATLSTNASLTAIDAAKSVFTDPNYAQGLAIAALHQLQEIADARNGNLPQTHFLDDLVAGFTSAGFSSSDAVKMAFQFIGFYGARGASVDFTNIFAGMENYPVMIASYILTTGVSVLDAYTLSTGHPYSLPAEMQTTCEYGRPYHFWMSAYIAHELAGRFNTKSDSAMAPHITGVGYESMGLTITRLDPWDQLTRPANDIANMSIRINISMNDAGAIYGANYEYGSIAKAGDIEGRISQLVNATSSFVPLTEAAATDLYNNHKLQYLQTWKKLFQPELGFKP